MLYKQSHLLPNMQKVVYYNFVYYTIKFYFESSLYDIYKIIVLLYRNNQLFNYIYLLKNLIKYLVLLTIQMMCIFNFYFLKSL